MPRRAAALAILLVALALSAACAKRVHQPATPIDPVTIYLVENDGPTTNEVRRFARILESSRVGPLPFRAADNLPFGKAWNTGRNYSQGMNFSRWAGTQPGIRFAATVEIPYANVSGQPVTAETARAFGADLARALRTFLDQ